MHISAISNSEDNVCAIQITTDSSGNPTASTQLERKGKRKVLLLTQKQKNSYLHKFAPQLLFKNILSYTCPIFTATSSL